MAGEYFALYLAPVLPELKWQVPDGATVKLNCGGILPLYWPSMLTKEKVITSFADLKAALAIPSVPFEEKEVPLIRQEKLASKVEEGSRNEKRQDNNKSVINRIMSVF